MTQQLRKSFLKPTALVKYLPEKKWMTLFDEFLKKSELKQSNTICIHIRNVPIYFPKNKKIFYISCFNVYIAVLLSNFINTAQ